MAVGVEQVGHHSVAQPEGLRPNAYDLNASDIEVSDGDDDARSSDNYHPSSDDDDSDSGSSSSGDSSEPAVDSVDEDDVDYELQTLALDDYATAKSAKRSRNIAGYSESKYYARFEDDIGISSDSDKRRKQGKRRKTAAEALREKLSQFEPEDVRAPWHRDDEEFKREEEKPDLKTSIKPEFEYNTVAASQIKTSATPFPDSVHIPQPDTITVACRKKSKFRKDKTHEARKRESNDDERSREDTPERQHDPITDSTTSSAFNYATAPDCANTDNEPLGTTTHFLPPSEPSRRVTDLLETTIHIKTKDPSINLRTESILLQDFVRDGRIEPLNKAESCTRHDLSYAKFSSCLLNVGIDTSRYELNFNHPSTAKLQISDETTLASFIRAARREARSSPANPTLYVSRKTLPVEQSDSSTHARSSGRMLDIVSSSTNFTPMSSKPLATNPVTCNWMTSEPSPLHHYRPLSSSSTAPISIHAQSKATRQRRSPSVKGFLPAHKHPSPGRQAQQEVISISSDSDE